MMMMMKKMMIEGCIESEHSVAQEVLLNYIVML